MNVDLTFRTLSLLSTSKGESQCILKGELGSISIVTTSVGLPVSVAQIFHIVGGRIPRGLQSAIEDSCGATSFFGLVW